jgi:serine/threonine protein phosphatase PrpC
MISNIYLSQKALVSRSYSTLIYPQPFREGVDNLKKAWEGKAMRLYTGLQDKLGPKENVRPLSLVERVKHLSVGLILLVPLINTVALLILRRTGAGVQRPPLYIPNPTHLVCWDRVMAPFAAHNLAALDALEYRIVRDPAEVKRRLEKEYNEARKQQILLDSEENSIFRGVAEELEKEGKPEICQKGEIEIANKAGQKRGVTFDQMADRPVAFAEAQGLRVVMEDTHFAETFNYLGQQIAVTALFDGHGGRKMADYAKEHLIKHLQKRLNEFNPRALSDEGIWNALKVALVDLSRSFKGNSGATANICMRIGGHLWAANLGDSRAILLDPQGELVQLTEDQKPADKKYERGIKKRGGLVLSWPLEPARLDGELAVARALGDHCYKGHVSARPKITRYPLPENATGYHLIQGCDGVWDVATSKQVGQLAQNLLKQGYPLSAVAAKTVEAAFQAGSGDNISVIVRAL